MITKSNKWSQQVVDEATQHDFTLETVYNNIHSNYNGLFTKHCKWCGQSIVYVAVVKGTHTATKAIIERHIGCDCLGHLLGTGWRYYSTMTQQVKALKSVAAIAARQVKYSIDYATQIAWLQSLPSSMFNNTYTGHFLSDMLVLLTTGKKVYSTKMHDYLMKLMKDQRFQPATMTKTVQVQSTELQKIETLLKLIAEVDGDSIQDVRYRGSYNVVKSVFDYVKKMNGATRKQLDMLNSIFKRYNDMKAKKIEVKAKLNLNDPAIPF